MRLRFVLYSSVVSGVRIDYPRDICNAAFLMCLGASFTTLLHGCEGLWQDRMKFFVNMLLCASFLFHNVDVDDPRLP